MMIFNEELMCHIKAFSYTYLGREGILFLEDENRCDGRGCVNFFKRLDPNVQLISVFAGTEMYVVYFLKNGEWHDGPPPRMPAVQPPLREQKTVH